MTRFRTDCPTASCQWDGIDFLQMICRLFICVIINLLIILQAYPIENYACFIFLSANLMQYSFFA